MTDGGHHWAQGGVCRFRESEMDPRIAQALATRQVATLTHLPTGIDDATTTVLTLPPGRAAIEHAAGPDELLYVVVQGELLLRWGETLSCSGIAAPGDMVLVPPWIRHVESNASDSGPLERLLMTTT